MNINIELDPTFAAFSSLSVRFSNVQVRIGSHLARAFVRSGIMLDEKAWLTPNTLTAAKGV